MPRRETGKRAGQKPTEPTPNWPDELTKGGDGLRATISWLSRGHLYIPHARRTELLTVLEWIADGLDELHQQRLREKNAHEAAAGALAGPLRGIAGHLKAARSNCFRSVLNTQLAALAAGNVTLTADDYFQFWTDMPRSDDIVLFKATTRLSPEYWDEPEMKLYVNNQIQQIRALAEELERNPAKKEKAREYLEGPLKSLVAKLEHAYRKEKLAENIIGRRIAGFSTARYERVFIIDVSETTAKHVEGGGYLDAMARAIASQVAGGLIDVRVIPLRVTEMSTFDRPQDFGVVATLDGDAFGMFCDVDHLGNPRGGIISVAPAEVEHYVDRFLRLRGYSRLVPPGSSLGQVKDILTKEIASPRMISAAELYGNRCETCLVRAEKAIATDAWRNDTSPLRTWHQIVAEEDAAIREYLVKAQPRGRVLEIGCGPGRVLRVVAGLRKDSLPFVTTVVGYEQSNDMVRSCNASLERLGARDCRAEMYFVGFADGEFSGVLGDERKSCGLVLAVSNIVGWQAEHDAAWVVQTADDGLVTDGSGRMFFTVYRRGRELERARMYKAAGDIVKLRANGDEQSMEIALAVDVFGGEEHVTRAYSLGELKDLLTRVETLSEKRIRVSCQPFEVGTYMWGVELELTKLEHGPVRDEPGAQARR